MAAGITGTQATGEPRVGEGMSGRRQSGAPARTQPPGAKRVVWMGLLGLLVCPSAAAGQATITLSPASAVVPLRKTQTFTAEVVGAPKIVYWSVCDANGKNCISGGNSKLGTIVDIGAGANGNRQGRYEDDFG